jgi:SMC interacting uncharacterized protein involved in chromosome segregation
MENSFSGVGYLRDEMNSKLQMKSGHEEVSRLESKCYKLENEIQSLQSQLNGLTDAFQWHRDNHSEAI